MTKSDYLEKLSDYVLNFEDELIADVAREYLAAGYPAEDAIYGGLVEGMRKAGDLYQAEEYFVTEILLCSDALNNAMEVLVPAMIRKEAEKKVKCVIGVVQGDTHDIGKNLVKTMLQTEGFEVIDLGRDVPLEEFVAKVKEEKAELVCLSTLMTTTMPNMKKVIELLRAEEDVNAKVMIGGGPVSQVFADKIGADGYSADAIEAVKLARRLTYDMT